MTTFTTNNIDPAAYDGLPVRPLRGPPPRLTEAERQAVNDAIYICGATAGLANEQASATAWAECAATLRGLLDRCALGSE